MYDTDLKGVYAFDGTWDCLNTPAGTVSYFANATAPRGYVVCDGASYATTQYPELFTAIGYVYGGAGANFSVPDLRGEFVRGIDNGRGVDNTVLRTVGSKQAGTLVVGDFDPTYSPIIMQSNSGSYQSLYGADKYDAVSYPPATTLTSWSLAINSATVLSEPALANYIGVTRPRNVALLPCIKF